MANSRTNAPSVVPAIFRTRFVDRRLAPEPRVIQVQSVKDLIVVVPRSGWRSVGELLSERPLKDQHWRAGGGELWVQTWIVKCVILVAEDLHGRSPRTDRRVGFGIPQFSKCGRLAERLHEYCNPAFSPSIPGDGPAVRLDRRATVGCRDG